MKKYKDMLNKIANKIEHLPFYIRLILVLIIPITILTYFLNSENIFYSPYEVERGNYGKEKTPYKINIDVGDIKNMEFDFSVSSVRYTEDEIDKIFDALYEKEIVNLLGDNEDYHHIKTNLNFKTNKGNGINMTLKFRPEQFTFEEEDDEKVFIDSVEYFSKYQNIIDSSGKVNNKDLSSDEIVEGYIVLSFSAYIADRENIYKSNDYYIEAKIIKGDTTEEENIKKDLFNAIKNIDKNTLNNKLLKLPKTINDKKIVYKNKTDYSFLLVPVVMILVLIILYAKTKIDKKEEEKKVVETLKIDYPQIVTKILIYVSSGLTINNSIRLIALTYEKKLMKCKNNKVEKRKAYEELCIAKKKLENGMGEIKVYEEMAKNINDRTYTRFINIIIQNIKNGNKDLKTILTQEVQDALYERKQRAKKLGEEASTKLVLPLMLMLFVIMIIIMVPAFMGMQ